MGRKSAITPDQFAQIERRHLIDGVSIRALAKEYGVDEKAIRRRISPQKSALENDAKPLLALASEKIEADAKVRDISAQIAALPAARQSTLNDLIPKLVSISGHLASGAEYGAATFHRLSALAHQEVAKIDDAEPLKSSDALRGIAALTTLANEAAKTPINLLAANKNGGIQIPVPELPSGPIPTDPIEAASEYQRIMAGS